MSRAKFFALAAAHGIEVEYDAGRKSHPRTGELVPWGITLDHRGKVFRGSGCHSDCSLQGDDEVTPDWQVELKALQSIVDEGFEDCDDPDCEWCAEAREAQS